VKKTRNKQNNALGKTLCTIFSCCCCCRGGEGEKGRGKWEWKAFC